MKGLDVITVCIDGITIQLANHLIFGAISVRIHPKNSLYVTSLSLSLSNSPKITCRLSFLIALMKWKAPFINSLNSSRSIELFPLFCWAWKRWSVISAECFRMKGACMNKYLRNLRIQLILFLSYRFWTCSRKCSPTLVASSLLIILWAVPPAIDHSATNRDWCRTCRRLPLDRCTAGWPLLSLALTAPFSEESSLRDPSSFWPSSLPSLWTLQCCTQTLWWLDRRYPHFQPRRV